MVFHNLSCTDTTGFVAFWVRLHLNLEQQITNKQIDTFRRVEKAWCFIAFWKCWILDLFWFSSKATAARSVAKFVEVTRLSSHCQVWNNLIRWDLQFQQYLLSGVDIVLAMLSKGLWALCCTATTPKSASIAFFKPSKALSARQLRILPSVRQTLLN